MVPDRSQPAQGRKEHPYRVYKREQEIISRRKIYRTTAFYSSYTIILLVLAIRSHHFLRATAFVPFGIVLWMTTEYFSHRFILHRHWKISQRRYKRFWTRVANKYFDPLHFGHHERPFDGEHMSGRVKDLLPLFLLGVPLSILLFPPFTASIVVAFAFQSYIAEEWIHHATHFYNFRDPYFRYMKKHHLYHHTSQGMTRGFGTSSGILDFIFMTRYPSNVRRRLYAGSKANATNQSEQQIKRA
ncbi:MAG TPA: sterol desaturase family protein [Pyrinomonadaceae bacterium]|jgi:sterol desaturase/sphingolipid hydroxylase (fatty acid hydroxylase superfamily)